MKKKSQLQIQEMAFMLIAVIFLFALVGLFFLTISYKNMYERADDIAKSKTISAITNLADSPEFSCTVSKSNCVDADKAISIINNSNYKKFWSFSSLKIVKLSAFNKEEDKMIECNFADYPNCEIFIIYDRKIKNEIVYSSFVALCRKEYENGYTYDKCEIAKLAAGMERKTPSKSGKP